MSEQLKACPFCGSPAEPYDDEEDSNVGCSNRACIVSGPDSRKQWQSRPIEDKQAELIEKLAVALSHYKNNQEIADALSAYRQWKEEN